MKKKITLTILLILLIITIGLGSTYAYWQRTSVSNNNIVSSSCLDVELNDYGDLRPFSLTNTYPMTDEEGLDLVPYYFNVTNNCGTDTKFTISIETLKDSTLDEKYIKYNLEKRIPELSYYTYYGDNNQNAGGTYKDVFKESNLGILGNELEELPSSDEYKTSHVIYEDVLSSSFDFNRKVFYLNLWLDYDSPIEETINKTWESKIKITAIPTTKKAYTELITGQDFQKVFEDNEIDKTLITSINTTNIKPSDEVTKYKVSTEDSLYDAYMYLDNTDLMIYSEDKSIYLNEDSSYMFRGFNGITNFDPSCFDFYNVRDLSYGFFQMSNLKEIDLSNVNLINVENIKYLVGFDNKLTNIKGFDEIHLDGIKDLEYAFLGTSLSYLNLSTIRSSNLTSPYIYLTGGNSIVKTIDLSNWDMTKATILDLAGMSGITKLILRNATIGGNTRLYENGGPKVQQFYGKNYDTFDVTNAKLVGNVNNCFANLFNSNIVGLSTLDTSRATSFENMFSATEIARYVNDFATWDVSNVLNFNYFFNDYSSIPLDLSALSTWNINPNAEIRPFFNPRNDPSTYTLPNWSGGTWQSVSGEGMSFIRN